MLERLSSRAKMTTGPVSLAGMPVATGSLGLAWLAVVAASTFGS